MEGIRYDNQKICIPYMLFIHALSSSEVPRGARRHLQLSVINDFVPNRINRALLPWKAGRWVSDGWIAACRACR